LREAMSEAQPSPARAIGAFDRKGSLEPGKDADIAIFDAAFEPVRTIEAGETAYAPLGHCEGTCH
jgi:N-acetylglucosamine-6-phosphate deacetylase